MTIHLLSADHRTQGLEVVSRLGGVAAHLGPDLLRAVPGLDGVLVLGTCNRLSILLDTPDDLPTGTLRDAVAAFLGRRAAADGPVPLSAWSGHEAHLELFATAAGLESMVVGEREIAGQLRRALLLAGQEGTVTGALARVVEHASAASRHVAASTALAHTGRSIVAVALDLAARRLPVPARTRALVVGTGAYAGATVATLRARGVGRIEVHSRSDRARAFAEGHHVGVVDAAGLPEALRRADLVVTCRGLGAPVLTRDLLAPALRERVQRAGGFDEAAGFGARPLVVLDLALSRDVDRCADVMPGLELIDLATVQRAVPDVEDSQVAAARRIVAHEVAAFERAQAGRRMDPVVRRLRSGVEAVVEDEVARLRAVDGGVDVEEAARALRHLAARILHHPTVAARRAGEDGRERDYLDALDLVIGPEIAAGLRGDEPVPDACPAGRGTPSATPEVPVASAVPASPAAAPRGYPAAHRRPTPVTADGETPALDDWEAEPIAVPVAIEGYAERADVLALSEGLA